MGAGHRPSRVDPGVWRPCPPHAGERDSSAAGSPPTPAAPSSGSGRTSRSARAGCCPSSSRCAHCGACDGASGSSARDRIFSALKRVLNFIDGQFRPPCSGRYLPDVDPATGQVIAEIAESGPEDVDAAVAAASRAFESWRRTPAEERSRLLIRVAELIEENFDELARLESEDSGKPIALARRMDVPRAILNFRFFATAILHAETRSHMTDDRALNYTLRQPLGVAGLISPWNLPLYLLTWKIAPAIAAGNCCVAKPSELTPLTADRLAALTVEAGIPPGVVNIVHGPGGSAGRALTSHPNVPLISFTGGTQDGRGRDGPRGTALQEGVAGARREEPEHRVRGRRSRAGRRHVDPVELRQPGGDLPLWIAPVRRESDLRRVPRALPGGNEEAPDRRPAGRLDRRRRARERAPPSQGRRLRRAREGGGGRAFSPAESVPRISRSASGAVTFWSRR